MPTAAVGELATEPVTPDLETWGSEPFAPESSAPNKDIKDLFIVVHTEVIVSV